nr:WG repeat-containing protein [uncultured Flavobacterium sp.]
MKRLIIIFLFIFNYSFSQDTDKLRDSLKAHYEYVGFFKNGIAEARTKQQKYTLLNTKGQPLFPATFSYIYLSPYGTIIASKSKGNKSNQGVIDASGKVLLLLEYDNVFDSEDGLIISKDKKYGVADKDGKMLLELKYDNIQHLGDGLFSVKNRELEALYRREIAITGFLYKSVRRLKKGNFAVTLPDNSCSVIDSVGNQILKPQKNHKIIDINKPVVIISNYTTHKFCAITTEGKKLTDYYNSLVFANNQLIASKGKLYGVIAYDDTLIVPFIYTYIYAPTQRDFYLAIGKNQTKVLNSKNESLLKGEYKSISHNKQCLIATKKDGLSGTFTFTGTPLLPVAYQLIAYNDSGKAIAKKGNSFYCTNLYGNGEDKKIDGVQNIKRPVDNYEWTCALIYQNNSETGLISMDGSIILKTQYKDIDYIYDSYEFIVNNSKKYGIIDVKGTVIVPAKYDKATIGKESIHFESKTIKPFYYEIKFNHVMTSADFRNAK